jgi:hypothetical protein
MLRDVVPEPTERRLLIVLDGIEIPRPVHGEDVVADRRSRYVERVRDLRHR